MAESQPLDAWNGPVAPGGFAADSELARLAAGFLEPGGELDFDLAGAAAALPATTTAPRAAGDGDLVLPLEEVIGDGNGEVVFCNEVGLTSLTLQTDAAVVARGTATGHAPVGGEDINGFAFVSFDSGLTLYYPEGLELSLAPAA